MNCCGDVPWALALGKGGVGHFVRQGILDAEAKSRLYLLSEQAEQFFYVYADMVAQRAPVNGGIAEITGKEYFARQLYDAPERSGGGQRLAVLVFGGTARRTIGFRKARLRLCSG